MEDQTTTLLRTNTSQGFNRGNPIDNGTSGLDIVSCPFVIPSKVEKLKLRFNFTD